MKRHVAFLMLLLLLGIMVLGCSPPTPVASGPPGPPPPPGSAPPLPPAAPEPAAAPVPPETKFGVFAGGIDDLAARPGGSSAPPRAAEASPPAEPATERVKAEKGVGAKGRSLDPYQGMVVTPAKAFFSAKERIAFEVQVPNALNLYKATEGQGPKSHEEFMEKIIQFNRIKLPQLPPDARYVYDVETEQLMVERTKKQ
jgi:hypothetical protein